MGSAVLLGRPLLQIQELVPPQYASALFVGWRQKLWIGNLLLRSACLSLAGNFSVLVKLSGFDSRTTLAD